MISKRGLLTYVEHVRYEGGGSRPNTLAAVGPSVSSLPLVALTATGMQDDAAAGAVPDADGGRQIGR